ncbi:MAG: MucB/RseB C-terminal domain-containing protein [Gammaproteobacteria bacterium]|nr:MucB/RseB C-terminal domain-containing protein [Gammaproteobacteria bacterium]
MRAAVSVLPAACAAAVWASSAVAGPAEGLVRISEAARTGNYQGIVVYRDGEMLETLRLVHRFQDGEERERMVSLTGDAREILRRGTEVTTVVPAARVVTVDQREGKGIFPVLSQNAVQELVQYYEFSDVGVSRVAGRSCRSLRVRPRDRYRYGYEVCADTQKNVPLKVSLLGRDGRVLEQLMFTEVEYPAAIPDQALAAGVDTTGFERVAHRVAMPPLDAAAWVPQNLPPGFRVTMRDLRLLPGDRGVVEHLLISDGLSAVSIFSARVRVPEKPPEKQFNGMSQVGATHAYGRVVGGVHVTVVGEVPEETVRYIGDGVQTPSAAGTDD